MKIRISILLLLVVTILPLNAQDLKREVTLYNPYKPTLPEAKKRSFLPEISDTSTFKPQFNYEIETIPYKPVYQVGQIKAVSLAPDPLDELYRSFVRLGLGNYLSPLAEISIASERSKKSVVGVYARHFSSNGKIKLPNDTSVYAGYIDNDVSLFGKRFLKNSMLGGSIDYFQKSRYAYGYDTIFSSGPAKKDTRIRYQDIGAEISMRSLTIDSSDFSYEAKLSYDFFNSGKNLYQHTFNLQGEAAGIYKGFYAGSDAQFEYMLLHPGSYIPTKYLFSLAPFVKKNTDQWEFKLGFRMTFDKNLTDKARVHFYPDLRFGFSIVPAYLKFFTSLDGELERNTPETIIEQNPFIMNDGALYSIPNTDHSLRMTAGFIGNTGIGGNYIVSASYSMINDFLFFSNLSIPGWLTNNRYGNFFIPLDDDVELLKVHGEMSGKAGRYVTWNGDANWYRYTLTNEEYAWNKPDWDASLNLKYNLRNKILASAGFTAFGERKLVAIYDDLINPGIERHFNAPAHFSMNFGAEYRYSKILSFWIKANNISFNEYYEWAYYPTHRYMFMLGFSYSL